VTVLVLGGGPAGVACAHTLGDEGVDVLLVDRNDYHQFQPLLYQVATAQLPVEDIARPHRTIFREYPSVEVVTAHVDEVSLAERTLHLADGQTLAGSHLVMAAGARPNFFGVPGAAQHAFPLYSVADAERLRIHLQEQLQGVAASGSTENDGMLDVVVVGGGPTGVETTGALVELMAAWAKTGRTPYRGQVTLVDRGTALLGAFNKKAHGYSHAKLTKHGATVKLEAGVASVHPDRVEFEDGTSIRARTVVWGGGESGAAIAQDAGPPAGRGGRIDAQPDLTVAGFPGVYAVGDVANIPDRDGATLPQLGSVAQQSGLLGRGEHPARAARRADQALQLQGQGHHGDDRPQRSGRRGRQAPPRGRGTDRVRRLARCAREPAQRRAQQDRRVPHLGLGLLRPRPRRHRRGLRGTEAHRVGRSGGRRPPHLARRPIVRPP